MKRFLFLTLLIPMLSLGQKKLECKYVNHFGDTLNLSQSSSSFYLSINIEEYSNGYVGKFNFFDDTIYLDRSLNRNVLRRNNSAYKNEKIKDSILKLKNKEEKNFIEKHQWRFRNPSKFIKRNDTLYLIDSAGKIDDRKFKINSKEFGTYFINIK